jgi:hypothetical protein
MTCWWFSGGWPVERYGHFVAEGMIAALLPDQP